MDTIRPEAIQREYPRSPLVGVGGVIIERGLVLLIKRLRPPAQGEWSIPGGLVELGEPLKTAVAREIFEETGLRVNVGNLVELLERIFEDNCGRIMYHYIIADYICTVVEGILKANSDASSVAWVGEDELEDYNVADITKQVIKKALLALSDLNKEQY